MAGYKIKTPILALGGDVGMAPKLFEAMKPLGESVSGGTIENCGHYIPEEQPDLLAKMMASFFTE